MSILQRSYFTCKSSLYNLRFWDSNYWTIHVYNFHWQDLWKLCVIWNMRSAWFDFLTRECLKIMPSNWLLVFTPSACYFRLFFVWSARQLAFINLNFLPLFSMLELEAFPGSGLPWLLPFLVLLTLGNLWCRCLLRSGYSECFHFCLSCVVIFTLYEQKDVVLAVNLIHR